MVLGLRIAQGRGVYAWHRRELEGIERFVVFLGYPRSGHTLVGSLLDAHPEVVVANELDALGYVAQGVSRPALFGALVARDRAFERAGRRWTGYDYRVPGQWQGRWAGLRVIGDKEAGRSSFRLQQRPELLAELARVVGVPLVVVHVARHPLDVVARMALAQGRPVASVAEQFLGFAGTVAAARRDPAVAAWFDLRLEDLIADPAAELHRLCSALEVVPGAGYVEAGAALVAPAPARTRAQVEWSAATTARLASGVAGLPVLGDYTFPPPEQS